ncbi:MAG: hypothetical protein ACP5G2_01995 [Candidatus Bipolaricaulaceae bacterium]
MIWRAVGTARAHGLDPKVFLVLSVIGTTIHALYYLPCLKSSSAELAFLVTLRALGLAGPAYVLLKGHRVARALNATFLCGWSVSTAWHVCYFVFL